MNESKPEDFHFNDDMEDSDDDVLQELEDFVKTKKKKNREEDDNVYDMCDQMLADLNYLDARL